MKKVRRRPIRDLKFLKAARLRANTQAAVEKIDAEIAAYKAHFRIEDLNPEALKWEKLIKDMDKYVKLCLKSLEDEQ